MLSDEAPPTEAELNAPIDHPERTGHEAHDAYADESGDEAADDAEERREPTAWGPDA